MIRTYYCHLQTPIGPLLVAGTEKSVHRISFPSADISTVAENNWVRDWRPLEHVTSQIDAYFSDKKPLHAAHTLRGSSFQISVWEALKTVTLGNTASYGHIARVIGRRQASQAVAAACLNNPLALVVPCHRIISADGSLAGFSGGLKTRHDLLRHEGIRSMDDQIELFGDLS